MATKKHTLNTTYIIDNFKYIKLLFLDNGAEAVQIAFDNTNLKFYIGF